MDLQTLQTYENWPKEVLPGILFFGKTGNLVGYSQ